MLLFHLVSYTIRTLLLSSLASMETQIRIINLGKSQQFNETKINFTSP